MQDNLSISTVFAVFLQNSFCYSNSTSERDEVGGLNGLQNIRQLEKAEPGLG